MIPKVIHYCWFGHGELPTSAKLYIESWRKFFPDYEIKRWDESNFDVNICSYTAEAYRAKKYAFVSDYARLWIIYNYGGLYFDTDVEVIKPMTDIVSRGAFMGQELHRSNDIAVNPGVGIGAEAKHPLYKELLEYYESLHFLAPDGSLNIVTIVDHTTNMLKRHGLVASDDIQTVDGIYIYPAYYFSPIDQNTMELKTTDRTVSIHRYAATWESLNHRLRKRAQLILGPHVTAVIIKLKHFIRR